MCGDDQTLYKLITNMKFRTFVYTFCIISNMANGKWQIVNSFDLKIETVFDLKTIYFVFDDKMINWTWGYLFVNVQSTNATWIWNYWRVFVTQLLKLKWISKLWNVTDNFHNFSDDLNDLLPVNFLVSTLKTWKWKFTWIWKFDRQW